MGAAVILHVLRTALVKPAMNSAANTHAKTRKTQPTTVSQVAVTLAESVVRSQPGRAMTSCDSQRAANMGP